MEGHSTRPIDVERATRAAELLAMGVRQMHVAERLGISRPVVCRIALGKHWFNQSGASNLCPTCKRPVAENGCKDCTPQVYRVKGKDSKQGDAAE